MAEFEMPIEEQIRSLARQFGAVETKLESLDSRLDSIDSRLESVDSKLGSMNSRQDSMDSKLSSLDSRQDSMDSKLSSLDSRQDSMDSKLDSISIRLDDTRQIAKLGLEALQGMRETSDRTLTDMRRDHDDQIDLLKSLAVHVRKRVDRVEQPKRRRRS